VKASKERVPGGQAMLFVLAILVTGSSLAQDVARLPLETTVAQLELAPLERIFDGTVEAINQATVAAQTAGRVAEVYYDVDDFVEAGTPIIRFTDVEQAAGARQAEAQLQEAIARATEADDEFARAESLYEAGTIAKRDFDRALTAKTAAQAQVKAAQSAVKSARQQVEYTLVRAPYSGIVTERFVEAGETVSVGQPLMSGLSLESLRVTVDIPQQIMKPVRTQMQAAVLTDEGRVQPTSITVFPYANATTNTFTVRLELPEGQFNLYPGMFTKVAFVVGESQRLMVPTSAILRRSEVTGVYVVGSDQSVRLRQIRVGREFGESTEVLAGLEPGETIAINPVMAGIYIKTGTAGNHD
tara:strand:+ start:11359 stop:12429 length:1071 start_codon:yes stop_codon:yes gene_type:complete